MGKMAMLNKEGNLNTWHTCTLNLIMLLAVDSNACYRLPSRHCSAFCNGRVQ